MTNINHTELTLITPNVAFEGSYCRYIDELGDEERYPFPMDFDHSDFPAMLQKVADFAAGVNLPPGYVPSTTLWLVQHQELLGVVNIRHYLNDNLRHAGGHIGLGIRPCARGKGLSCWLLESAIERAREMGIADVHIHCYQHNEPSKRMIIACGGVLESEVSIADSKPANVVQRYVIKKDR